MTTILFVLLWLAVGFFGGMTYGTQRGYDQSSKHLDEVIKQLEKLYRERLDRLEKIIRERIINKV